jgi:hypothetical protein
MNERKFDISGCTLNSQIPTYMNWKSEINDDDVAEALAYLREMGYEDELYPYFGKDENID